MVKNPICSHCPVLVGCPVLAAPRGACFLPRRLQWCEMRGCTAASCGTSSCLAPSREEHLRPSQHPLCLMCQLPWREESQKYCYFFSIPFLVFPAYLHLEPCALLLTAMVSQHQQHLACTQDFCCFQLLLPRKNEGDIFPITTLVLQCCSTCTVLTSSSKNNLNRDVKAYLFILINILVITLLLWCLCFLKTNTPWNSIERTNCLKVFRKQYVLKIQ